MTGEPWHEGHHPAVKSFDALMDPMLIDSMEVQQQVLTDPVAADMLPGVSSAGLTGIGVLPGPIRLPDGITRRLLGPASYSGARIAYPRSHQQAEPTHARRGAGRISV